MDVSILMQIGFDSTNLTTIAKYIKYSIYNISIGRKKDNIIYVSCQLNRIIIFLWTFLGKQNNKMFFQTNTCNVSSLLLNKIKDRFPLAFDFRILYRLAFICDGVNNPHQWWKIYITAFQFVLHEKKKLK